MRTALITGAAGFIGSHLVDRLVASDWNVVGIDNFDPFYDPNLKERNLEGHCKDARFTLIHADIRECAASLLSIRERPEVIVHLAAKVGVRSSIAEPAAYYDVNVRGMQCLLELARQLSVRQFIFASSSSVYGLNPHTPWREDDNLLLPISPYASTKISGELMGHVYAHLFGIRFVALRLFTVYGPRQRPDLAIHRFSRLMREGKQLSLFGSGASRRAYTFIDDVIAGICAAMEYDCSPYEVFNIGSNHSVSLRELVTIIEQVSGLRAAIRLLPEQAGDLPVTCPNVEKARRLLDYEALTDIHSGLKHFWQWLDREKR